MSTEDYVDMTYRERMKERTAVQEDGHHIFMPLNPKEGWENTYGVMKYYGKPTSVLRITWEENFGPVPQGHDVRHQLKFNCPKRCINPEHLKLYRLHLTAGRYKNTRNKPDPELYPTEIPRGKLQRGKNDEPSPELLDIFAQHGVVNPKKHRK